MMVLISILAFVVAIGILVTVHEFGHFWVAKRLGVKVLRFSIGFGKPLVKSIRGRDQTEYMLAAVPLGGYVKMLDEREGEVAPAERHRAFNRQRVWRRIAIVAAGPVFNFLLAIVAYWFMFIVGVSGIKPIIGDVQPGSLAADAGLTAGTRILAVNDQPTPIWQTTSVALLDEALSTGRVEVTAQPAEGGTRTYELDLRDTRSLLEQGDLLSKLGITPWRPTIPPVIDKLVADGAGAQAGLKAGDKILAADDQPMANWSDWVEYVRAHPATAIRVKLQRGGEARTLMLHTGSREADGKTIGRIGAYPRIDEQKLDQARTIVRYNPVTGLLRGVDKTWEMSALTLRVLGRLVTGGASLKNISGPVTIAEYAGISAVIGVSAFLGALALFSLSIGLLNLLPVPVLDGGHLLYYLIEIIKGSPVSEVTEAIGQRIGLMMLVALMGLAFYNDFERLLS